MESSSNGFSLQVILFIKSQQCILHLYHFFLELTLGQVQSIQQFQKYSNGQIFLFFTIRKSLCSEKIQTNRNFNIKLNSYKMLTGNIKGSLIKDQACKGGIQLQMIIPILCRLFINISKMKGISLSIVFLILMSTCTAAIVYSSQEGVLKINQKRFYMKGASWFGFETGVSTVHGLWAVDYKFIVNFLASNKFNAVRLPFYLDLVLNDPIPTSIKFGGCSNDGNCNNDLRGLRSLQVLDKVINYMGTKGIVVMLDMHSFEPDAYGSNGLWYDSSHSESLVIQGWRKLADRYRNTWNVFAIDVKNQPFQATWGSGNMNTDFNKASQRIGETIINDTNWLVFVEGTANSPQCNDGCFYGEDLQGVKNNPVQLSKAGRVVYSPHVYGPQVYNQKYFDDPSFPANMPKIWDQHFGFIRNQKNSAIVTGEWGGSTSGKNGLWLNAYANYLKSNDITDNFFWCINPNSGDTGGLLLDDWMSPDSNKLSVLAKLVDSPTDVLAAIKESMNLERTE